MPPGATAGAPVTTLAPALTYTPPGSSPAELELSHLASSPHDSITSPPPPLARTPPLRQGGQAALKRTSSTPPASPLCKIDEEDAVAAAHGPALPATARDPLIGGAAAVGAGDPHPVDQHPGLSASLTSSSIADGYAGLFSASDDDGAHGGALHAAAGGAGGIALSFSDSIMDFLKTSESSCDHLGFASEPPADEDSFRMWQSMDAGEF
jgi:hypothetical protein